MYLGEITRNILLSLVDAAPRPILFNGLASRELNQHYGLDTAFLSEVEEAWEQGRVPKSTEGAGVEGAHALNTVAVGEVRADDPKREYALLYTHLTVTDVHIQHTRLMLTRSLRRTKRGWSVSDQ